MEPERADALVGRLLDRRYRIGPRIARGGMASVYEATDIRLDRTVAVKVMHAGLGDDDEFAARFVREARAAARLNHPNVVNVFDQGDDDGTVFLAMEYVPGHTLRDVIRKEAPMTPLRAIALIEPVVSALAAAHRAGLMHRDVKPENVLIAAESSSYEQGGGQVKVADFGLARAVSADTQHTATGGVLIGTVSYLAPELVVDGKADARADVYAVGVVLFELLTGTKPHEGESPIQVAYKHVHDDVPAPSSCEPGIPAYVDALVARATARDRTQRPADASVLLHQLHRVAHALSAGVAEDEELTADLMPRVLPAEELTEELAHVAASPLLAASDHHPTTTIERPARPDRPAPASAVPVRAPAAARPRRPRRPRRSRRGPLVLLLALLLVVGVGVAAWWFGFARYTPMPGVLGMTETAAVDRLERAGLSAETGDPAYSETVRKGKVLGTDPDPGSRVLDGGTVTLVLSLGKERYDVPKLRGMSEDEAQDALARTNLGFGDSTERWHATVPAGVVITSDPAAATRLRPDTAVDLVVSKGPRPVDVRDFTGKDAEQARAWLERKELDVEVVGEEHSDTVPEGHVISQDPTEGNLYRGDTVELVVSQGPELVEVPRVVAMGVDAATEKLEALGFTVEVENDSNYIGVGFVFRSDPSAGSMAPKGSTITLYLI